MIINYKFAHSETLECESMENLETLENYNDIVTINCSGNKLTSLPTLPQSLIELYCYYNLLTSLPTLPNSLTHLHCSINRLILLPILPIGLEYLNCQNNLLTFIPKSNDTLTTKFYYNNPVDTYIRDKCDGDTDVYHRENEIFALKLVNWYLDGRENPMYKFCRTRLNREYDALMDEDVDRILC